jgi:DNA repair photolyase
LSEVQDVTYQTMSVLLQAGIEVSFLTKGFVTHRFLQLFADQPQLVFAQIGITTLDDRLRQTFEPYTASPLERLKCIESLRSIGVATTARLDPLIPDVSDTEDNLRPLFESLQEMGITGAAVSYLFVRPAFQRTLMIQLEGTTACQSSASWRYQPFAKGCGGGKTLELGERKSRFDRVVALGNEFGIQVSPCRCKNPEIGVSGCRITGPLPINDPKPATQTQLEFTH